MSDCAYLEKLTLPPALRPANCPKQRAPINSSSRPGTGYEATRDLDGDGVYSL